MGRKKTNIEALLVRHILLHGRDCGEMVVIECGDLKKLAAQLGVDYAAMTRRINESMLIVKDGTILGVIKD